MPSLNSITRTIRFAEEDVERIESVMKAEDVTFNAAVHRLISEKREPEGVHSVPEVGTQGIEIADIRAMISVAGISEESFYRDIDRMMNEGSLEVSRSGVRIVLPEWAVEVEDVCHDCGISVKEAMKNIVKALRRGTL